MLVLLQNKNMLVLLQNKDMLVLQTCQYYYKTKRHVSIVNTLVLLQNKKTHQCYRHVSIITEQKDTLVF